MMVHGGVEIVFYKIFTELVILVPYTGLVTFASKEAFDEVCQNTFHDIKSGVPMFISASYLND